MSLPQKISIISTELTFHAGFPPFRTPPSISITRNQANLHLDRPEAWKTVPQKPHLEKLLRLPCEENKFCSHGVVLFLLFGPRKCCICLGRRDTHSPGSRSPPRFPPGKRPPPAPGFSPHPSDFSPGWPKPKDGATVTTGWANNSRLKIACEMVLTFAFYLRCCNGTWGSFGVGP